MIDGGLVEAVMNAGTSAGTFVLVLILLLRRPPAVATLDESVERWIGRLEKAFDEGQRRELARERLDAEHRAWDQGILLAVALGTDANDIRRRVEALGPPPRLTPDPAEWLQVEERRHTRRAAAAPLAPDTNPRTHAVNDRSARRA